MGRRYMRLMTDSKWMIQLEKMGKNLEKLKVREKSMLQKERGSKLSNYEQFDGYQMKTAETMPFRPKRSSLKVTYNSNADIADHLDPSPYFTGRKVQFALPN